MTRKTELKTTALDLYGVKYELSNKSLATNINTMINSLNGLDKSRWTYAQAVANIINNKYYADDFKDVKSFCKAVGLKNATVTKLVMACDFRNVSLQSYMETLKNNGIVENVDIVKKGMTVNKCYYLQTLVKINKFVDFISYIGVINTESLYKMSERELEELMKKFKDSLKEETKPTETKEETKEETEPTETNEETLEEVEWVEIIYQGSVYDIPRNILDNYKVKDINEETETA